MKYIINKLIQDIQWFAKKCVKFGSYAFVIWGTFSIILFINKFKMPEYKFIIFGIIISLICIKFMDKMDSFFKKKKF